jgi:predicted Zn-dependent protease
MPLNGNVYKFTGVSAKEKQTIVEDATKSLRTLTEKEKNSIMQKYLSVVIANGNENITELSKRTANKLSPELTAIINSIDPKEKIKKGKQIKIVLERVYGK